MKKKSPKKKMGMMSGTIQTMAKNSPGLGRSQGMKQMSTPVSYHHGMNTPVSRKNISLA